MAKFASGGLSLKPEDKEFLLTQIKPLLKHNDAFAARTLIQQEKKKLDYDDNKFKSLCRIQEFLLSRMGEENYFRGTGNMVYAFEFSGCPTLEKIVIPNNIIAFDEYAFANSKVLEFVSLPSSFNFIGEDVFNGCSSLTTVKIENGKDKSLYITDAAFYNCPCKVYVKKSMLTDEPDPEGFLIDHLHYL